MAKLAKEAQEEVAKLRGQESTYLQDFPANLDVVRARELSEWQFNLNKKWKVYEEVTAKKILQLYPEVALLHTKLVPSQVSSKEFWQRYNYWCDEKRWIKEFQRRKEEHVKTKFEIPLSTSTHEVSSTASSVPTTGVAVKERLKSWYATTSPAIEEDIADPAIESHKRKHTANKTDAQEMLEPPNKTPLPPFSRTAGEAVGVASQPASTPAPSTVATTKIVGQEQNSSAKESNSSLKNRLEQWNKATIPRKSVASDTKATEQPPAKGETIESENPLTSNVPHNSQTRKSTIGGFLTQSVHKKTPLVPLVESEPKKKAYSFSPSTSKVPNYSVSIAKSTKEPSIVAPKSNNASSSIPQVTALRSQPSKDLNLDSSKVKASTRSTPESFIPPVSSDNSITVRAPAHVSKLAPVSLREPSSSATSWKKPMSDYPKDTVTGSSEPVSKAKSLATREYT